MALIKAQRETPNGDDERRRPRDREGLIGQLTDEDPGARRRAARDLGQHADVAGVLIERLQHEADLSVRDVILTTLVRLGDARAYAGLASCLRSADVALRNAVIEAMRASPADVAPIVSSLLLDADPDIRIFAVNILESLCHPDVESWLVGVIARDAHVNVCATAVDLLCEVGTVASRPALLELKARFPEEPYIHFAADLALQRTAPE
jgi:hypothetical protein